MKKIYSSIMIGMFIAMGVSDAQPTMTAANFNPVLGESFTYHSSTPTALIAGAAGANVTWNFASMANQNTVSLTFVTAASTGYGTSFPTANIAGMQPGAYEFDNANSNLLARTGYVFGTLVFPYSDEETIITYPFTFNNTFNDNFAGTYFAGATYYRTGQTTGIADGYGTLILPWGTITNVLRVRWQETYRDSTSGILNYYTSDNYAWFKPGTHYFLCNVSTTIANGTTTTFASTYLDQSSVGIKPIEPGEIAINLYPNPSSEFLNVKFNVKRTAHIHLSVSNVVGQEIYAYDEGTIEGDYNKIINVSVLAEGVYILNVQLDDRIKTTKFLVKKSLLTD
ncbi:MAG: T9SS type A sorting domain-containing protein [Bacteroidota bacterium]